MNVCISVYYSSALFPFLRVVIIVLGLTVD